MRRAPPLVQLLGLVLAVAGSGAVAARAASVGWSPAGVGMALVATPRCTSAGLLVTQNLSAGTVVSVTVASLPSACGNATLQVTVNNGSATGSGSATVPAAGGSVTVTLGSAPAVTASEQTDLVLLGP